MTAKKERESSLVSVVIVAHNNWPDLELAIESALNQSHRNTEVLVVDNGSTDQTATEVERLYSTRVRYIRQANLHGSAGYNRGIAESLGEFIQLLDGDDFIAPNKIEKQLRVFNVSPEVDIVYGDVRQIQEGTGRPNWYDWETTQHEDMLATLLDPAITAGLLPHSVLFRRRTCERVGPWDENILSADPDYWLRAAWTGCVFHYCPGSWCYHRRRATSVSGDGRAMVDRMEQTYEKAATYIDREPYRSAVLARLARLHVGRAVSDRRLSRLESLARLELARRIAPGAVPLAGYAMAYALVGIPGVRAIAGSPSLAQLRRHLGRLLHLLPDFRTSWQQ